MIYGCNVTSKAKYDLMRSWGQHKMDVVINEDGTTFKDTARKQPGRQATEEEIAIMEWQDTFRVDTYKRPAIPMDPKDIPEDYTSKALLP